MGNYSSNTNNNNSNNSELIKLYSYIPDIKDFRDVIIDAEKFPETDFKEVIDLRGEFLPIFPSCDVNCSISYSISAIIYHELLKLNKNIFFPSRVYIYYNSKIKGEIFLNEQPSNRETLKSISKWGFCPEQYCPFNTGLINNKPTNECYKLGQKYSIKYYRIPNIINDIKLVLNNNKSIICSIPLYSSFMEKCVRQTGRLEFPEGYESIIGSLSIVIVGYIESKELIICRFPFGNLWGDHGYGYINYDYLLVMGMDLWIIDIIVKSNITITNDDTEIEIINNNKRNTIKGRYI